MKLKKNDEVKIVSGKDKGKTGKVEKVYPKLNKVLVHEINQFKRHLKKQVQGQESQIVVITKPLTVEAVSLICPNCHKITRVGTRIEKSEKLRFCRKCNKLI